MAVQGLTQQQIDGLAAEGRRQLAAERATAATTANVNNARLVAAPQVATFRGRRLRLRALPFDDGLRLMELGAIVQEVAGQIAANKDAATAFMIYRVVLLEVAQILHWLERPRFVPRWVWWFKPNRFRYATHLEMLEMLRFCGRSQMMSPAPSAPQAVQ